MEEQNTDVLIPAIQDIIQFQSYDEIPEADWSRVEQWFKLQFPGKMLPESTTQGELF